MTDRAQALLYAVQAGRWLIGIAVLHALFGLWFGRDALLGIARDGFFDAVDHHASRGLVFWFLLMSPFLAMLGQLLISAARAGYEPPGLLGWELLVLTVAGVVLMPASGFWLALVPAALLLRPRFVKA